MNEIYIPKIITGNEIIKNREVSLNEYGKCAFILTDSIMKNKIKDLYQLLDHEQIKYQIFSEINSEPTNTMVEQALNQFHQSNCDYIIGIGGGSILDSAKIIATTPTKIPLILIPTTAGTGSEVTKFSILTDEKSQEKRLIINSSFIPDLVIIDYSLTSSLPKSVTAATGLDAFCHAIEAYTSKKANSFSDMFALSAIKRIIKYLPIAYQEGTLISRREMMLAALEAGIAFNHSSVTIIHGMSRPIGALFHIPHGISNAMLLQPCMTKVSKESTRFLELAQALSMNQDELMNVIKNLCSSCHIPQLLDYGIDKEVFMTNIDKMACDALKSGSPQNTRIMINKEIIINLYKELIGGN